MSSNSAVMAKIKVNQYQSILAHDLAHKISSISPSQTPNELQQPRACIILAPDLCHDGVGSGKDLSENKQSVQYIIDELENELETEIVLNPLGDSLY